MTRITPFRFTILHLSQIFLTEALTFTVSILFLKRLNSNFQIPRPPFRRKEVGGGLSISPGK